MNRQAGRGRRERRDGATHLKGANVRSRTRIRPRGVEAIEVVEDEAPIHTWTRRVEVQRLVNEQWVRVDTLRFLASARPERRERAVGRRVVPARGVVPRRRPTVVIRRDRVGGAGLEHLRRNGRGVVENPVGSRTDRGCPAAHRPVFVTGDAGSVHRIMKRKERTRWAFKTAYPNRTAGFTGVAKVVGGAVGVRRRAFIGVLIAHAGIAAYRSVPVLRDNIAPRSHI